MNFDLFSQRRKSNSVQRIHREKIRNQCLIKNTIQLSLLCSSSYVCYHNIIQSRLCKFEIKKTSAWYRNNVLFMWRLNESVCSNAFVLSRLYQPPATLQTTAEKIVAISRHCQSCLVNHRRHCLHKRMVTINYQNLLPVYFFHTNLHERWRTHIGCDRAVDNIPLLETWRRFLNLQS